jgi:hypothetical protein
LIHVDLHSDYLSPRCNIDQSASPESIHKLIQNKSIAYDEFIKPAIQFGIVKTVAFCCNPKQRNVYGNFNNYGSPIKIVEMLLDHNNHQALHKAEHNICNKIRGRNLILDIDLDFFLDFIHDESDESVPCLLKPKDEHTIIQEIRAINTLFDFASITTIATSPAPDFSWDDRTRREVENIFSNNFKVPIDFTYEPEDITVG